MLKIIFGDVVDDRYVFNPAVYFRNTYEDDWLTDGLAVEMIQDVDGSKVIGASIIDSPYLGMIPPERLSRGVKTLILMEQEKYQLALDCFNRALLFDATNEAAMKNRENALEAMNQEVSSGPSQSTTTMD